MRIIGWATAGLTLALASGTAQAQQLTASQEAIAAELKARGYQAEMIAGEKSDYIHTSDSGVPITIFFANCANGRRGCTTLQFFTGFTDINLTLEEVNQWSRDERWVRTYIDDEGDPVLEMDVNMDYGGLGRDLFWDHLKVFIGMVSKFRDKFGG